MEQFNVGNDRFEAMQEEQRNTTGATHLSASRIADGPIQDEEALKKKKMIIVGAVAGVLILAVLIIVIAVAVKSGNKKEEPKEPEKKYAQTLTINLSWDPSSSQKNENIQILNPDFTGFNVNNTDMFIDGKKASFDKSLDSSSYKNNKAKVEYKFNHNLTTAKNMFKESKYITEIDLTNFIGEHLTDASFMFQNCTNLVSFKLGNKFKKNSIKNMASMFENCENIISLNLSELTTSSVEDMNSMFHRTRNLTSLDISTFDTSQVTSFYQMFCTTGFTFLNLSNFKTNKAIDMRSMLSDSHNLTSIDISSFDTSQITSFEDMLAFSGFRYLDLTNFNTSKATDMSLMFAFDIQLTSIDISSFDTSQVTTFLEMFENTRLTYLNVSNFNTSKAVDMSSMFVMTPTLTSLDLTSFDTSSVTDFSMMFFGTDALKHIDLCSFIIPNDTSAAVDMMFSYTKEDGVDIKITEEAYNNLTALGTSGIEEIEYFDCSGF